MGEWEKGVWDVLSLFAARVWWWENAVDGMGLFVFPGMGWRD